MTDAPVIFERHDHQAWITLNRPAHRNVMNAELLVGLLDAWHEVRTNDDIRVAVVTAAGDVDFCCGGDLGELIPLWTRAKEPETDIERRIIEEPNLIDKVMLKDQPMVKPVVAAVNGRALGGGTELLLATDIRIAADTATFALPEPKAGVVPGAGSMVRLARQLPWAHAMKVLLGGEPIDASTALDMGLISEVVSAVALRDRAAEVADNICRQAPLALQAIKRTALESHTSDWPDAFDIEKREAGLVLRSDDAREGPRAFKEKRPPRFEGR